MYVLHEQSVRFICSICMYDLYINLFQSLYVRFIVYVGVVWLCHMKGFEVWCVCKLLACVENAGMKNVWDFSPLHSKRTKFESTAPFHVRVQRLWCMYVCKHSFSTQMGQRRAECILKIMCNYLFIILSPYLTKCFSTFWE